MAPEEKSRVREYVEALVIAVVLALFVRTFVVQAFKIPSGSMIPTLLIGDHILVNKFIYGIKLPLTNLMIIPLGEPRRGDVIVFKYPQDESKDFIKRVIGLPGDRVEVRHQQVYVNDTPLTEPYAVHQSEMPRNPLEQPRDDYGPVTVPSHAYFVMGDNRDHSLDSRYWGFVTEDKIKGRAFLIYWSWDGAERWDRWGTTWENCAVTRMAMGPGRGGIGGRFADSARPPHTMKQGDLPAGREAPLPPDSNDG